MKHCKRMIAFGLAAVLALGTIGCAGSSESETENADTVNAEENEDAQEDHKIGVAVYSTDDDEVQMFQEYYKSYLEEAFPVEFVYSPAIQDYEDETAFVDAAREEGCEGIISFITYDLPQIVEYCGDDMYYMMGSGTLDQAVFNEVKTKENFLGIIGPSEENEKDAGVNMIKNLAGENGSEKTYVLLSGAAGTGIYMHQIRLIGMLETLQNEYGFALEGSAEELSLTQENILAGTSADGGKIYIVPGVLSAEDCEDNMDALFEETTVDVIASTFYAAPYLEYIEAKEAQQNKNIEVGAVDCFCDTNREAFEEQDAFGNSKIDYIAGKCAAMAAPSFVAMYNAVSGYPETVRDNGEAFWLHQNFWSAATPEEYDELSNAAKNIYTNVYGTKDIMEAITAYTGDAAFEDFKEFVDKIS